MATKLPSISPNCNACFFSKIFSFCGKTTSVFLLALVGAACNQSVSENVVAGSDENIVNQPNKISSPLAPSAIGYLNTPRRPYAAVLIDPNTVITACHVIHRLKASDLTWNASSGEDTKPHQVTQITCYNKGTDVNNVAKYDVALLQLDGPVNVEPLTIRNGTLPPTGALVSLWGTGCIDRKRPDIDPKNLQAAQFRFSLNAYKDGPANSLVCNGDSGGPYIYQNQVFAVVHGWHAADGTDTAAFLVHNDLKNGVVIADNSTDSTLVASIPNDENSNESTMGFVPSEGKNLPIDANIGAFSSD